MADWIEDQIEESKRRYEALPDWLKEDYSYSKDDDTVEISEVNQAQEIVMT